MASIEGPLDVGLGYVYWSAFPTERDCVGCGGLYVDRVVLKPFCQWPLRWKVRLLARGIGRLFFLTIKGERIGWRNFPAVIRNLIEAKGGEGGA